MQRPFKDALPVLDTIESAGFEAYFVGGSVRDSVLGRPIGDIDIATSARPEQIKDLFTRTVDLGIEHGTVLVLFRGETYEVTTFRTETGYKDFRRPDEVIFVSSLHEDLMRRDFTINAMAMDRKGRLLDPFGGREDIAKKQIRTVGRPIDRFSEDALRMMRAVRFVSQLQFSLERETMASLSEASKLLTHIAVERKRAEFEKTMLGQGRSEGIRMLSETGLLSYLPGLRNLQSEIMQFASYELSGLGLNEMWALLLHCTGISEESGEDFLRLWKLPVKQMKEIIKLLRFLHIRLAHEWDVQLLYRAGSETIVSVEKMLAAAKEAVENRTDEYSRLYGQLPIYKREDMAVSGGDLIEWSGKRGGPWVSEQLKLIEEAILYGRLENKKERIKEWLFRCNQK